MKELQFKIQCVSDAPNRYQTLMWQGFPYYIRTSSGESDCLDSNGHDFPTMCIHRCCQTAETLICHQWPPPGLKGSYHSINKLYIKVILTLSCTLTKLTNLKNVSHLFFSSEDWTVGLHVRSAGHVVRPSMVHCGQSQLGLLALTVYGSTHYHCCVNIIILLTPRL